MYYWRWSGISTTSHWGTPQNIYAFLSWCKHHSQDALHGPHASNYTTVSTTSNLNLIFHNNNRHGPLVRYWTMRFEARHKYFKKLASKLGNFINIIYTLAIRHQQLQCYQHISKTRLEGDDIDIGPSEIVSLPELVGCVIIATSSLNRYNSVNFITIIIIFHSIFKTKWIRVNGTLYKKPCGLVVGAKDDLPLFGNLQNILTGNGKVYFHVQLYKTLYFSDHYHAYLVELQMEYKTLLHSELTCYSPLHVRFIPNLCKQNQKAIVLKYHFSTL